MKTWILAVVLVLAGQSAQAGIFSEYLTDDLMDRAGLYPGAWEIIPYDVVNFRKEAEYRLFKSDRSYSGCNYDFDSGRRHSIKVIRKQSGVELARLLRKFYDRHLIEVSFAAEPDGRWRQSCQIEIMMYSRDGEILRITY